MSGAEKRGSGSRPVRVSRAEVLNLPDAAALHVVVTPSQAITSLLPHNCDFATVVNHTFSDCLK